LDLSIEGAKGVLFNIAGGSDLTMFEVDEAAKIITASADADANIIFGAVIKSDLADQVRITVIATGFDETRARLAKMNQRTETKVVGLVGDANDPERKEGVSNDALMPANSSPVADDNNKTDDPADDDVFGAKFEIPAFLRKIRQ
jgi:cell division protein FtsZ